MLLHLRSLFQLHVTVFAIYFLDSGSQIGILNAIELAPVSSYCLGTFYDPSSNYQFLNYQENPSVWPARAWFLEIVTSVCMCAPEGIATCEQVLYDWLNKFNCLLT